MIQKYFFIQIRFEWADIFYDISKTRHLYWTVSLMRFYLIRQPNQSFELYYLCLEVHCIRYELHLFKAKAFPLLKLIMTSTGWGAVSTTFTLKVFGLTRTRTRDLTIQIHVCYYWAKSARFIFFIKFCITFSFQTY